MSFANTAAVKGVCVCVYLKVEGFLWRGREKTV